MRKKIVVGAMAGAGFLLIGGVLWYGYGSYREGTMEPAEIVEQSRLPDGDYSAGLTEALDAIKSGEAERIIYSGKRLVVAKADGEAVEVMGPPEVIKQVIGAAEEHGTLMFTRQGKEQSPMAFVNDMLEAVMQIVFIGLLAVILTMVMRMHFGAGRDGLKPVPPSRNSVRFSDVAGIDSARQEIEETVSFLMDPSGIVAMGARAPRGVILSGPPGVGKTLLAKAMAGEAGVSFFSLSGADFDEVFVGTGMAKVKALFDKARENAPCIIFIDEFDALAGRRQANARKFDDQTLNQLLVEMDGFDSRDGVVVIAATNRVDMLDSAVLRPGRFDRKIALGLPDLKARSEIAEVHSKGKALGDCFSAQDVARMTSGMAGADIANLLDEAVRMAHRRGAGNATVADVKAARDRIVLGLPSGRKLVQDDRHRVAVHESGHALVSLLLPHADNPDRATIVPHGDALGMVASFPEDDRLNLSYDQLRDRIAVLMAGRAGTRRDAAAT